MENKVLVYIETDTNKISKVSLEIIAYLADCNAKIELNALLLTSPEYKEKLIEQLEHKGLDNLFVSVDNKFKEYAPQTFTTVVTSFLKHNPQDAFLMGATPQGRELAPRVASRNNLGLTADCTQIDFSDDCLLLATRPTYGGELMATIVSKTKPNFATVRPGALKSTDKTFEKQMNVIPYNTDIENIIEAVKILTREKKEVTSNLENAVIIAAGGLGLKTKENFEKLTEFAKLIGAELAASRAAVELGWAPQDIQVGQTGHTVAPKLYIAFGISGAMQHLVGIKNSDKIIAVNTDRNAPVFESADIGIVTDAPELLKNLIEYLKTSR